MSDIISGVNSLYSSGTYTTGTSSSTSALEGTLGTDLSTASDDELMSVCKEFESYFVEQVFKAMEKMVPTDEDDEDSFLSTDSSSNTLTDYFKDELITNYASLATESNDGQGLGIAQTLYEQMKRNYTTE